MGLATSTMAASYCRHSTSVVVLSQVHTSRPNCERECHAVCASSFSTIHQRDRSRGQHMKNIERSILSIAPVKTGKTETVTLRQLGIALAESHGMTKAQANAMLT